MPKRQPTESSGDELAAARALSELAHRLFRGGRPSGPGSGEAPATQSRGLLPAGWAFGLTLLTVVGPCWGAQSDRVVVVM
ncbi:dsRBD fold-containing protein [Kribbella steppae]|uniref:dsRBD fold-containing protein n=1 Tax=Kribbella steppae TaxID=2512223 RepID=UPI00130E3FC5